MTELFLFEHDDGIKVRLIASSDPYITKKPYFLYQVFFENDWYTMKMIHSKYYKTMIHKKFFEMVKAINTKKISFSFDKNNGRGMIYAEHMKSESSDVIDELEIRKVLSKIKDKK